MRDLETIRLAMTAAETGHLVFGTLHTSSAAKTIDRIVDVFPAEEKEMVRAMLSESLRAVISQTLLKTKDGNGRVAAHEIMIGTPAIRNLIRENKVAQMYSMIQTGQQHGMQTLDQTLLELVRRNVVSIAEARQYAKTPETFRRLRQKEQATMERDQATRFVHDLLRLLHSKKGSDLFITADFPPAFKIDGRVLPVSNQPLTSQHTSELVRAIMNDRQASEFEKTKECNFAINPTGIGRFRVSAFVQQGKVGIVFRTIADHIPTTDELNLPNLINELAMAKRGIIIVVGATGSGKSTSLAAMVGYRNENSERPHHHDRGPDRIRPPAQELHHHAARSRRGLRVLADRAEEHAAPGARRDPDRRGARARNDGTRDRLRRNRPPGDVHACTPTPPTRRSTGSSTSSPRRSARSC